MKKILLFAAAFIFISGTSIAQWKRATQPPAEIDPSKPTNLYTQVNGQFEYQSGKKTELFGFRTNIQYAINSDNLVLAEIPFLYNNSNSESGLSDIRVRYFRAVKRNISPKFIAIAPFADISIPVGSFEKGLGSSSWSLAGGVVLGFVVSPKFAIFPGISYIHITKPSTDLIPENLKFTSNGVGFQLNGSYSFSKRTFMFINPTPQFINSKGDWKTIWAGEFSINRIITPNKFKINASFNPNFTDDFYVYRLGATLFL